MEVFALYERFLFSTLLADTEVETGSQRRWTTGSKVKSRPRIPDQFRTDTLDDDNDEDDNNDEVGDDDDDDNGGYLLGERRKGEYFFFFCID